VSELNSETGPGVRPAAARIEPNQRPQAAEVSNSFPTSVYQKNQNDTTFNPEEFNREMRQQRREQQAVFPRVGSTNFIGNAWELNEVGRTPGSVSLADAARRATERQKELNGANDMLTHPEKHGNNLRWIESAQNTLRQNGQLQGIEQGKPGHVPDLIAEYARTHMRLMAGNPNHDRITLDDINNYMKQTPGLSPFAKTVLGEMKDRYKEIENASGLHGHTFSREGISLQDLETYRSRAESGRQAVDYLSNPGKLDLFCRPNENYVHRDAIKSQMDHCKNQLQTPGLSNEARADLTLRQKVGQFLQEEISQNSLYRSATLDDTRDYARSLGHRPGDFVDANGRRTTPEAVAAEQQRLSRTEAPAPPRIEPAPAPPRTEAPVPPRTEAPVPPRVEPAPSPPRTQPPRQQGNPYNWPTEPPTPAGEAKGRNSEPPQQSEFPKKDPFALGEAKGKSFSDERPKELQSIGNTWSMDGKSESFAERIARMTEPKWERYIREHITNQPGGFTADHYQDALKYAAKHHKPVVAVFGSHNDKELLKAIETKLAKGKSVYVFVDTKTVDPSSSLGKYAKHMQGHQAVKFDVVERPNGKIQPQHEQYVRVTPRTPQREYHSPSPVNLLPPPNRGGSGYGPFRRCF